LIKFKEIRTEHGVPGGKDGVLKALVDASRPEDTSLADVAKRVAGVKNKYFTTYLIRDEGVCYTITAGAKHIRTCDGCYLSDEDIRRASTFPEDYDFNGNNVNFVCGMCVPPNMMANIATEVWNQWLK
jgi:DNA (cytosine-5)-methyltransferase 1